MPDNLADQLDLCRELVDQRLELGDHAEVPREVDHFALFPPKRATEAIAALRAAGFQVGRRSRRLLKVGVQFHQITPVDHRSAAEFTRRAHTVVSAHGGSYDGWGALLCE